jgi:hypothetical protein
MMCPLPLVVLSLLALEVRQFRIHLRLFSAAEFLEACYRVHAAKPSKPDCCSQEDRSVVAFLFVQVVVEAHG